MALPTVRRLKAVVFGSGRSGTGYMAAGLTAAGMRCGHEAVFTTGGYLGPSGWTQEWEADSSWLAFEYLPFIHHDQPIIHVYRHPGRVIASFMAIGFFDINPHPSHTPYRQVMAKCVPGLFDIADPFERACEWYVASNSHGLKYASLVEQVALVRWPLINTLLGGELDVSAIATVPLNVNSRTRLTDDLPPLPESVTAVYNACGGAALKGIL